MPKNTDQHEWSYPAAGESDYEDTFETFFDQLDGDVEIRDSDANKSNYSPEAGAKFLATDTENVYIGDGSNWNHLVSTGKNPSFDSLDTEELSIGQGFETADPVDDVPGIQDAIDSLPSSGGQVYLKSGVYNVLDGDFETPAIIIDHDDIAIVGPPSAVIRIPDDTTESGKGKQIIDIGESVAYSGSRLSQGTPVNNVTLKGFTIDGNQQNQNQVSGTFDGHNIEAVGNNIHILDIRSINSTGDGVEITSDDPNPGIANQNIVMGCTFLDNFEQNVHLHGSQRTIVAGNYCDGEVNNHNLHLFSGNSDTAEVLIANNIILNSDKNGAQLSTNNDNATADRVWFVNNLVMRNGDNGIGMKGGDFKTLHIEGNGIFENGKHGITGTGADGVNIKNNGIAFNDEAGIIFTNGQAAINGLFVRGNWIRGNNQEDVAAKAVEIQSQDSNAIKRAVVANNDIISRSAPLHNRAFQLTENTTASEYTDIIVENNYLDGVESGVSMRSQVTDVVEYHNNHGFLTENEGNASVSDGDTISHGLDVFGRTPSYASVTATVDGHIASVSGIDDSDITVGLFDDAGSAVTSDETVYWRAVF